MEVVVLPCTNLSDRTDLCMDLGFTNAIYGVSTFSARNSLCLFLEVGVDGAGYCLTQRQVRSVALSYYF